MSMFDGEKCSVPGCGRSATRTIGNFGVLRCNEDHDKCLSAAPITKDHPIDKNGSIPINKGDEVYVIISGLHGDDDSFPECFFYTEKEAEDYIAMCNNNYSERHMLRTITKLRRGF